MSESNSIVLFILTNYSEVLENDSFKELDFR